MKDWVMFVGENTNFLVHERLGDAFRGKCKI